MKIALREYDYVGQAATVLAFTLIGAIAFGGFRYRLEDEPSHVKALGGALAFLSVGLALVVALVIGHLSVGFGGWPLGAFLTTCVYLGLVSLEIAPAELLEELGAG